MNDATKGSLGCATSSPGVPIWRNCPSTITPMRSASAAASSKSWVTSRDGYLQTGKELLQLRADVGFRVSVQCGERLVEQQDIRVAGERTREGDALPLPAGEVARPRAFEMRDVEALEVLVGRVAAAVLDVLTDGHVRKERVVLKDEADASPVGRQDDAAPASNQTDVAAAMRPDCGRSRPATARRTVVFPAPDGPTSATVDRRPGSAGG